MAYKVHWSGKFNLHREVIQEEADAYTEEQAKFLMSQKIAFKAGVIPQVVWEYLKHHPHCYEINRGDHHAGKVYMPEMQKR